jgi:hypothetical protein
MSETSSRRALSRDWIIKKVREVRDDKAPASSSCQAEENYQGIPIS